MEDNIVGEMLRGQAWVELHGQFTLAQLLDIVKELEENMRGLEKKNGDTGGHNNRLGSIPKNSKC